MRTLAISHVPIWPVTVGSAVRRTMALEALRAHGPVDLVFVGEADDCAARIPPDAGLQRVWERPVRRAKRSVLAQARWLIAPDLPIEVAGWDPVPQDRPLGAYDLAWSFGAIAHKLAPPFTAAHRVVDLEDLIDERLRLSRAHSAGTSPRLRVAIARNATAWRRHQRRLADSVDAVTLCSELDRDRFGADNCFVVPNGVRDPSISLPRTDARGPSILLLGFFSYGPNRDAAEFFVEEIFPRIRAREPGAEVRLVGRANERVHRLARPGVTVVGEVEDVAAEYGRAMIAVAPIRFGSGTRIKIIEAFSRGVPVVATSLGCEGLGARDGEHLLIGDDARSFAAACCELLQSRQRREDVAQAAHDLYRSRFTEQAVAQAVDQVVRAVSS
jgi:glycosyltransferase involved in cell wall biosynthesis